MEIVDKICSVIIFITAVLISYRTLYLVLGFLCRAKKYPHTDIPRKYAVVIAARNEEAVVGNLIESIRKQTLYPDVKIFVVADNCTDSTAELCRSLGASVYERFDKEHARKGYAMEYLFDCIERDYGITSFDGYFIFDADNLMHPQFIEKMNDAFNSGEKIITSYRNTKNFDTNWISSGYGIHFCNNSMQMHRPRSVLGSGTHLTGTGYLISSELISDGWHYVTFTEDDQITMAMVGNHHKVAYCEEAEFYDEQPRDFKTVMRQRVRWAKGRLINFFKYGNKAFRGIFRYGSWTCYDMYMHYFPYGLFSWILGAIYPIASFIYDICVKTAYDSKATIINVLTAFGTLYVYSLLSAILTVFREKKHIICKNKWKLVFYTFTAPWFNMITVPVYIIAIFTHVEWKPIVHNDSRKIDTLVK